MDAIPFEDFLHTIGPLGGVVELDPSTKNRLEEATGAIERLPELTHSALTALLQAHPDWAPIFGLIVGLSHEQLRNVLRYRLGSASWNRIAKTQAGDLIVLLDGEYGLLGRIEDQRTRQWSLADVLAERYVSRIHMLWQRRSIDGLYTLSQLASFRRALEEAARRLGLVGAG